MNAKQERKAAILDKLAGRGVLVASLRDLTADQLELVDIELTRVADIAAREAREQAIKEAKPKKEKVEFTTEEQTARKKASARKGNITWWRNQLTKADQANDAKAVERWKSKLQEAGAL